MREKWKQLVDGRSGNPTFRTLQGGFLRGDITQHDGNTSQAKGEAKRMDIFVGVVKLNTELKGALICGLSFL